LAQTRERPFQGKSAKSNRVGGISETWVPRFPLAVFGHVIQIMLPLASHYSVPINIVPAMQTNHQIVDERQMIINVVPVGQNVVEIATCL
jgi:hypothetical protein